MSNLNGRKVRTLRLHQTSQAAGFGTITTPINCTDKVVSGVKSLEMIVCEFGIYCKGKGPQGKYEFLIPMHNVVSLDLVEETKEEVVKK